MEQLRAVLTEDIPGKHTPIVIKIGGSVLDDATETLDAITTLWQTGRKPVLVHGGGPMINQWLDRLGIVPQFIDGRRVTDAVTLEVVRTVLIGQVNTELVRVLSKSGVRAIGLNGMGSGLIRAHRAAPALGLVGLVDSVDISPVQILCDAGFLPVIAPLCLGPDGECLNVNADDVATAVAIALDAEDLIFLSNVPGVRDTAGEIVHTLTRTHALDMIAQGIISGGMVPKIESCLNALEQVHTIHILDGADPRALTSVLSSHNGVGTMIVDR